MQLGTPREIYERPSNSFVADFVGTSNVFTGAIAKSVVGKAGDFSIRPERMTVKAGSAKGANTATGKVVETIYIGGNTRVVVDLEAGQRINVMVSNEGNSDADKLRGASVTVSWSASDVVTLAN